MKLRRSWFAASAASAILLAGLAGQTRADDAKAVEIIDKAVKALGGEETLSKVEAATWSAAGKLVLNGADNAFNTRVTFKNDDHMRVNFEGDFGGNTIKGSTVVNGDKGWRKVNDNQQVLDADEIVREKRTLYIMTAPALPGRLKGKGFKATVDGEEKVDDEPADVLKVVGPDGKDFRLFIDKESGLPVKLVARVVGWDGQEFEQETMFFDYKDYGGIKRPSRITAKRDGEPFVEQTLREFKVEKDLPADTFEEPK